MQVELNGEKREVPDGTSVRELLETLGLDRQPCAVEVNRTLVPRARHTDRRLASGDRIEIVTLVGGG